jgi:hypothetical protein
VLNPIAVANEGVMKRVVYSPHVYGPDVFNHGYFKTDDFRDNLPKVMMMMMMRMMRMMMR